MRFPDSVTLTPRRISDAYGNPGKAYAAPDPVQLRGFLVKEDLLLLPASADLAEGDRLETRGRTFEAVEVEEVRSPAKTVLWTVTVKEVPR